VATELLSDHVLGADAVIDYNQAGPRSGLDNLLPISYIAGLTELEGPDLIGDTNC
jgi:hypothetical protein